MERGRVNTLDGFKSDTLQICNTGKERTQSGSEN